MAAAVPDLSVLARDQAFETLYRTYVEDVYHYALALLRNPADAEDVTQTTFLNAYRAYQRGIEVEKPQNWLIRIAHNVARTNYARASCRVKEVPLEDHVAQLAVPEAEQPDVIGVLRALGRLPFNQRAALVMRELEGRSYAEIADTIGVSVSAVETLIFRARKSLRVKASAVRSLAAVPLPASLTQLFESGGIVAGGGGAVGTGFLVKAAVALVAGAFATGIGGDRSGPTAAAAGSMPRLEVGLSRHGADGLMPRPTLPPTGKGAKVASRVRVREGSEPTAAGTEQTAHVAALAGVSAGSPAPESSSSDAASQLTDQVLSVVSTVEEMAEEVPAALPVQAPSLPPVPVDLPKLSGETPLP
jgi:RNA polymerase sigma factor (sigma-70 family)